MGERNLSGKYLSCKRETGAKQNLYHRGHRCSQRRYVLLSLHKRPPVGRISMVSTVAFGGSMMAFTTAAAMVAADIIFLRGACGQNEFQMSVLVAPGMRAITRMPLGRSSSRRVLVRPSAPCFEAT